MDQPLADAPVVVPLDVLPGAPPPPPKPKPPPPKPPVEGPCAVALTRVAVTVPSLAFAPWITTVSPGWIAEVFAFAFRLIVELLVVLTRTVLPLASLM